MQTILLTGGTGFVGAQVYKALLREGVKVILVVRSTERSKSSNSDLIKTVYCGDLFAKDIDWWRELCSGVDVIIHCAWYVNPGDYLESIENIKCLQGSLSMAQGAILAGVKKIVGVGTCLEYDQEGGWLSTKTHLKPNSLYASTKVSLYYVLRRLLHQTSVDFSWCRLFYLYGENENETRLAAYVKSKLDKGEVAYINSANQVLDFLDVAVAGGEIARVALGGDKGAINICSGVPVTIRAFVEKIADDYGRRDLLDFTKAAITSSQTKCVVGVK